MSAGCGKENPTPDWGRLYEIAGAQDGHFTTAQAAEVGYYPQLIAKHLANGRMTRVRRGVYRLVHFPAGDQEELVVIWLWSGRAAIFSHETALALHGLSDALPARVHITLPSRWARRRLRVPKSVALHHADIDAADRTWLGTVPVTAVPRTLVDCAEARVAPELVRDAFEHAAQRGLVDRGVVPSVVTYLEPFYSVSRDRSGSRFRSTSSRPRRVME